MAVNIKSAGKQEATQAQEGKNLLFGTSLTYHLILWFREVLLLQSWLGYLDREEVKDVSKSGSLASRAWGS